MLSPPMMDNPSNLGVDVNLNHLMVRRPRTPTSPNPLDNEDLRRRSTGLSAFNDYVDLVKRHLMYAVREEVEILKQQIGEMMERIGQLEYENTVLKAEAKPETLNKLQLPRVTQATSGAPLSAPVNVVPNPQPPQQAVSTMQGTAPQSQTQIHVQGPASTPSQPQSAQQTPLAQSQTSQPSMQATHPPST
ncbi:hypothetical protein Btru_049817 [Bulinus truncatus]|nr:hypothetical protein Btru_049817 [Bulinus truncatus]